jgi:predicted RNA binding protein YcfA (HicA-like mRNA interferase family)
LKRREFIRELVRNGCVLQRHGGRHDLYVNRNNGRQAPVPRHSEIKDSLCELIRKQLGLSR